MGAIGKRSNLATIAALRRAIRTYGVVPFVGAGISKQCGFPLWAEFLADSARKANGRISELLLRRQFEEAAELLLKTTDQRWLGRRLEAVFGHRPNCSPATAARRVPQLTDGPVVTTNFDGVQEQMFREAGRPFHFELWGGRPTLTSRSLEDDTQSWLKYTEMLESRVVVY